MRASGAAFLALCLTACASSTPIAPPPIQVATPLPTPSLSAPPVYADFALAGQLVQGGLVTGVAPQGTIRLTLDGSDVPVASDGKFIIGLDRDHPGRLVLRAVLPDGRSAQRELQIAPRSWSTQRVDIAQRPTASTAEFLRIREGELARIAAARAISSASQGWRQRFVWPAKGRISGVFGSQRIYRGDGRGAFHSGVDVAAGAGGRVLAPADGIVVLAGQPPFSLEGNLIIIDHGMGLNSAFLHLASQNVREGDMVKQGQFIGTVGATGRATGPHLHWSMKLGNARIDPQPLAGPMG